MFKNAVEKISKFYELDLAKNSHADEMFDVLNEIIKFESAAIFYLAPNCLSLEFGKNFEIYNDIKIDDEISKVLYNKSAGEISDILKPLLKKENLLGIRLIVKDAVIGVLVIERNDGEFSFDEKIIFETCAKIIANLIKDLEISNVLKLQVKAMQEGLIETCQSYEVIKKQNKKIKENEKLQNAFIANISHDLRTPLNSIIGLSEALAGKFFGDLNAKQQDYVEDIKIAGIKLLGMINEILDITKIESHTLKLNLSEFQIKGAVFEACNIIAPIADKKEIRIEQDVPEDLSVTADYLKLQQILLNLLGNAVKYAKSKIVVTCTSTGKKVRISVKDDGEGIAKEHHKKIFNKFYQVQDTLSKTEISTGLGLTIVKEFVKLHGGKVEVKSELASGTEFVVIF